MLWSAGLFERNSAPFGSTITGSRRQDSFKCRRKYHWCLWISCLKCWPELTSERTSWLLGIPFHLILRFIGIAVFSVLWRPSLCYQLMNSLVPTFAVASPPLLPFSLFFVFKSLYSGYLGLRISLVLLSTHCFLHLPLYFVYLPLCLACRLSSSPVIASDEVDLTLQKLMPLSHLVYKVSHCYAFCLNFLQFDFSS